MSILDSVLDDSELLKVEIDFSSYDNGAKYSTLARAYFERNKDLFKAADISDYFARLLLNQLKEALIKESSAELLEKQKQTDAEAIQNEKSIIEKHAQAIELFEQKKALALELDLKKK
jgi:hypothetical protein